MFLRILDKSLSYQSSLRSVEDRYGFVDIDIGDEIQVAETDYISLVVFDLKVNKDRERRCITEILKTFADVPIVAVCDFNSKTERAFWSSAGVETLLHKSETPKQILAKISGVLEDHIDALHHSTDAPGVAMKVANGALMGMAESVQRREPLKDQMIDVAAQHIVSLLNNNRASDWLSVVEMHHSQTFHHSMLVASNITIFSKGLGLPPSEQCLMTKAGLLHDIGKMHVPLEILDKPGKLTKEEMDIVKRHPDSGADFLKEYGCVEASVISMTRSHHEFLDGSGYPDGLMGDAISPVVRMMTIADIFSALTEKRAYKDNYSPRVAIGMMWEMNRKLDTNLLRQWAHIMVGSNAGKVTAARGKVA